LFGSLELLGGEPGIGKSTLLLQAAANLARTVGPVLYSSGEESEHQVKSRGERLAVGKAPLYLLAGNLSRTHSRRDRAHQSRRWSSLTPFRPCSRSSSSRPRSIGQVREAATQLLFMAKNQNVPTLLVGHVTKDGSLAGPRLSSTSSDTVLYFEGGAPSLASRGAAVKNRFGAVSELGVFE
jgi:DNA repair protein RadA/Sms